MAEESLKHKTKKGLYWSLINQFSNYGLSFIVGLVMARQLTPEDYGITALPAVFIAVAGIFQGGCFANALVRKPEISDSDLSTAFYYNFGMGVLMYLTLFFCAPLIADFYDVPILTKMIRISTLGFIWGPLGTPQSVILNRRLDFKTPTMIAWATGLFSAAIGISMAYAGYGLWSLVINGLLSGVLGLVLIWSKVRWVPRAPWSKDSFKYLWGYGNKLMASALLDKIWTNITPVVIGKYYSPADLGEYNRASGYASLPSQNITGVIQSVTFPVLSRMQDNLDALAVNYRRMLKMTAFVVFPVMMLLAALSRPLVITMVTTKWEACIPYLQVMCFSMMWYPVHAINLNLLQVRGRSDLFLKLEIWKKAIGLGVMLITLPMGIMPYLYGTICTSMICLFINTYYTGKIIGVGYLMQMRDLLPIFGLSVGAGAVAWLVNLAVPYLWLQIFVGGSVGAVCYMGLAYLFKMKQIEDVKYMLNRKI